MEKQEPVQLHESSQTEDLKAEYERLIAEIPDVAKPVNRRFACIVIAIFFAILLLPTLLWGGVKLVAVGVPTLMEKIDFDTGENRKMATFPDEFDPQKFPAEVEEWYNDNLPFRSVLYKTYSDLKSTIEAPYIEHIRPALMEMLHKPKPKPKPTPKPTPAPDQGQDSSSVEEVPEEEEVEVVLPYQPPIYHGNNTVLEGREKWLFYLGDNSMKYYTGENVLTEKQMQEYTDTLITLNELCVQRGIQLQMSIFPNKEQVYSEYMPSIDLLTEYKRLQKWLDYVKENSELKIIYPLERLIDSKKIQQIYYKYDSHWNNVGAFIGYQAMLESLGFTSTMSNLNDWNIQNSDGAKADLIDLGKLSSKLYNGDLYYEVQYRPQVTVLSEEGGFANNQIRHTTSNGGIDQKLVLLGDSYREMMSPYIEKDFTECFLAHRGALTDDTLRDAVIAAVENADILVLEAVERYDMELMKTAKKLIEILSPSTQS